MPVPTFAQIAHNFPPSTGIKNAIAHADAKTAAFVAARAAQSNKTVHNDVTTAVAKGWEHALRANHAVTHTGLAGTLAMGRNSIVTTARLPIAGTFVARTAASSMMLADTIGEGVDYLSGQAIVRANGANGHKAWYAVAVAMKVGFATVFESARLALTAVRLSVTFGLGLGLSALYAAYAGVRKLGDAVRSGKVEQTAEQAKNDVKDAASAVQDEVIEGIDAAQDTAKDVADDAQAQQSSSAEQNNVAAGADNIVRPSTPKGSETLPTVNVDKNN